MKFVRKNTYYTDTVYEWNLPTGFTCPFANECLVKVDRHTGKFKNMSKEYRCYSANAERFPAVRNHRWTNFEFIKGGGVPVLPPKAKAVRIHATGDFFSQSYFDTWLAVCRMYPSVEFWAYTKSLLYWVKRIDSIPSNLVFTASYGGREDFLIEQYGLEHTVVIKDESEANGRPIDKDDTYARTPNVNFCLLDNFKVSKAA